MMGAGKTTIGKLLAEDLRLSFIDLDQYIELKEKKNIPSIFAEKGEEYFREKEKEFLVEVSTFDNVIISTGGGCPCFFDNITIMNQSGITIFLNVPKDEIFTRLVRKKESRPLLSTKSDEEIKAFIDKTLAQRLQFYKQAKHTFSDANLKQKDISTFISQLYSK